MKHKKIRQCAICGREFTIRRGSQVDCSDECYAKGQEKRIKEDRNKPKQTKKILSIDDVWKI